MEVGAVETHESSIFMLETDAVFDEPLVEFVERIFGRNLQVPFHPFVFTEPTEHLVDPAKRKLDHSQRMIVTRLVEKPLFASTLRVWFMRSEFQNSGLSRHR